MSDNNKRIILIVGNTETLGYFSKELAIYLRIMGREVFIWDMLHPSDSISAYEALPNRPDSVLVTFNFIGLNGEGQFSDGLTTIWERDGVEIISIMVDSPIYYFRQLSAGYKNIKVACVDRNHVSYVRRFHPSIRDVYFFPLCGNEPVDDIWQGTGCDDKLHLLKYRDVPYDERYIDILFIGNYVTPEGIEAGIVNAEPEYRDFLRDICDELIHNPSLVLEETLLRRLKDEFPGEKEEDYAEAMYHMVYVDLYVRSYFRARTVRSLTEAGFKVFCVGQDWDKLDTDHPENLIHTNVMMTSSDCVRALETAKVSLNVMPWFKAGAHDRIFSSMLAGCVALTDSSAYLDEILIPWEDHAPFTLEDPDSVICSVKKLNSDCDLAEKIIEYGRRKAKEDHTWKRIALEICNITEQTEKILCTTN